MNFKTVYRDTSDHDPPKSEGKKGEKGRKSGLLFVCLFVYKDKHQFSEDQVGGSGGGG